MTAKEKSERTVRALESIAISLEKLARPLLIRQVDGTVCVVPSISPEQARALQDWALVPLDDEPVQMQDGEMGEEGVPVAPALSRGT